MRVTGTFDNTNIGIAQRYRHDLSAQHGVAYLQAPSIRNLPDEIILKPQSVF